MYQNLLSNPLANPVALPVILLLGVVFGGAGLALASLGLAGQMAGAGALSRGKTRTPRKVLWQRYRTWAIIAPLFAGAALCGPLALAAICAFLTWQGSREYADLANLDGLYRWALPVCGWLTLAAILFFGPAILPWTM